MDIKLILKLLGNYSKENHLNMIKENLRIEDSKLNSLSPIISQRWDEKTMPYVAKSHILDAYYSLPERPDIGFTCLWKAINNSYNNYYLKQVYKSEGQQCHKLSDSKSLDKVLLHISQDHNKKISDEHTIESLIDLYISKIPDKTYNFVASYILKGMAIVNVDEEKLSPIYALSSYGSFKKKFSHIHGAIKQTYGMKYISLCDITVATDKTTVDFGMSKGGEAESKVVKNKSRKIIHSLSQVLKEILNGGKSTLEFTNNKKEVTYSEEIEFSNFHDRLYFLMVTILYSVRNNNTHGNVASRMNSAYANSESFHASEYIFLLGHMFLSLIMYRNGDLTLDELSFNLENI